VVADRVARRGRDLTPAWGQARDELIGQPQARLREIADQAARIVDGLDGVGDLRVDTDDRPANEIAAEILGAYRLAVAAAVSPARQSRCASSWIATSFGRGRSAVDEPGAPVR
jgi:hypothetical protein